MRDSPRIEQDFELPPAYDAPSTEGRWYSEWERRG